MITIDRFRVLKKLSVTNIRITPDKVTAAYIVEKPDGTASSYDHTYSYDEKYFSKDSFEDVNLASMMLAQVAINYGLFFDTIEFDGIFDNADRRFIIDMMENTSREIITNKLLIKNEFIVPPYDNLVVGKQDKYTQAAIRFVNTKFNNLTVTTSENKTDPDKYAILSSGGKDSLLTYGIISEIGEPYSVFINEAGRHWYTAYNAYHHYKETDKNTYKPWCNSDRVFNWMLKQLPFIKENYANIRADIYPIRLWTVAVFLFGVLPIVRKKGIGNVLIGDEYDTSMKSNLGGITHYNGLYDQSKYFDNALTRYYHKKGWNIVQYSILRSLSEMLIMKVLIKRYPELQQYQVSCHAAHKEGNLMRPCGNCEKCRRIIGMITALDEDPKLCGYNDEQIKKGLAALETKSVKQIGSDAAHLYYMLFQKKAIAKNEFTNRVAKSHPEIMKLRFDNEKSNLEDMPVNIRERLFDILTQYSDGAVVRKDNRWVDMEITSDFINEKKYKFDER